MHWQTTRFDLDLSQPRVMGIVNVTPDSFSDGGLHADAASACRHCDALVSEGADLLDIGGESTRPGASTPTAEEEWARVEPVLRHAVTLGVPVSVDTSQALVMRAALDLGVDIVNDVRALQRPGALGMLAAHPRAGLCLMHMRGEPVDMQSRTDYADVMVEVRDFLQARADAARAAGIARPRIVLDPGIGFGKTLAQNMVLTAQLPALKTLGYPLLLGWSRKSSLGVLTGRSVNERLAASLAAALVAVSRGAAVLRVHDVAATVDALKVWQAIAVADPDVQVRTITGGKPDTGEKNR